MHYDQDRAPPPSLVRRVFSLPTLISLALALAFLVFLATRFDVDLNATWQQVRSANPLYLSLALVIHYTIFPFRGMRWRLLLRNVQQPGETPPGRLYCTQLVLLSWFANAVTWFRLGDGYRAYLYHAESGAPFSRTIGTILSERLLDLGAIILLLALSLPFLAGSGSSAAWPVAGTAGALLGLLVAVLLVLIAARGALTRRLPSRLARRVVARVAEQYRLFRAGVLGSLRQAPLAAGWGLLSWLAEVARLYLVTLALGIDLSLPLVIFATLANSILTLAPTPGGLGAVESGLAGLLKQLSALPTPAVLALVLVDRAITYLSILVSGPALFLGRWAGRRRCGG